VIESQKDESNNDDFKDSIFDYLSPRTIVIALFIVILLIFAGAVILQLTMPPIEIEPKPDNGHMNPLGIFMFSPIHNPAPSPFWEQLQGLVQIAYIIYMFISLVFMGFVLLKMEEMHQTLMLIACILGTENLEEIMKKWEATKARLDEEKARRLKE